MWFIGIASHQTVPPGSCDSAPAILRPRNFSQNLVNCREFGNMHKILQKMMFLASDNVIPNFAPYFAVYASRSFFHGFFITPATTEAVFICFIFVFLLSCAFSFLRLKLFLYYIVTQFYRIS